jgi:hypothetical protein
MYIEYFTDEDEEQAYKTISVDIAENATIGTLISHIHEIANIPLYSELKLNKKNIVKVPCRYYFLSEAEEYEKVDDLEKKINEFPMGRTNARLRIYLNNTSGLVN